MVNRRDFMIGAGAGVGSTVIGGVSFTGIRRLLHEEPPEGSFNWEENPEGDQIAWDAEVQSGDESVFYTVDIQGPETDETLVDTGMPKNRSRTHNGDFKPPAPGTYTGRIQAETDSYDETLDEQKMTVWGPLPEQPSEDEQDEIDYSKDDLSYDSISEGLRHQSDSSLVQFDDFVHDAFRNRGESVSRTVDDASVELEGGTVIDYLRGDRSERDDIDVYLGFGEGEELKLRTRGSADMNRTFEEYMVGLEYTSEFENEMEEYVQDIADSI